MKIGDQILVKLDTSPDLFILEITDKSKRSIMVWDDKEGFDAFWFGRRISAVWVRTPDLGHDDVMWRCANVVSVFRRLLGDGLVRRCYAGVDYVQN